MRVKVNPSHREIQAEITAYVQAQKRVLIRTLASCLEQIINTARDSGSYTNRTHNLRSSIGGLIIVDGEVVHKAGFKQSGNGAEGVTSGIEYAQSLTREYPKGIAVIVVAGRDYASYVADRGYDVLDSAENLAETLVPQMLSQLQILK